MGAIQSGAEPSVTSRDASSRSPLTYDSLVKPVDEPVDDADDDADDDDDDKEVVLTLADALSTGSATSRHLSSTARRGGATLAANRAFVTATEAAAAAAMTRSVRDAAATWTMSNVDAATWVAEADEGSGRESAITSRDHVARPASARAKGLKWSTIAPAGVAEDLACFNARLVEL